MKLSMTMVFMALGLFTTACNYTGTPVEYAAVCDKANDDKTVEVTGFLDNNGSAMCSSGYGKPMRCPITFKDRLENEKWINAYMDKGKGSSEVDEYEKDKGLKIKDAKGEFIERSQKVKLVADVDVYDTPEPQTAGCFITVKKIEKVQ